MVNSVDPDEMAHYGPCNQDLRCLQKQWFGLQNWKEYKINSELSLFRVSLSRITDYLEVKIWSLFIMEI